MLQAAPPPPPVSYGRVIVPILAMQCNGCHGYAGGLSTRSHAELMTGGNLGPVVILGNPDASLLVHFIDGRRGEKRRMPLAAKPLPAAQIDLIRRWIAEGAQKDDATIPETVERLAAVPFASRGSLIITAQVAVEAYLVLRVKDPGSGRLLHTEEGAVKREASDGDAGRPGETITWHVHSGAGWPTAVNIELAAQYAEAELTELKLSARHP